MIDAGTASAVIAAGAAVVGVYLTVRSSIKRDHRDKDIADATLRRDEITEAIKAERERQELADTKAENVALRKKLADDDT